MKDGRRSGVYIRDPWLQAARAPDGGCGHGSPSSESLVRRVNLEEACLKQPHAREAWAEAQTMPVAASLRVKRGRLDTAARQAIHASPGKPHRPHSAHFFEMPHYH